MLYRLGQRQKSGGTDQPNTEIRCGKRILRAAVTGRLDDVASMGGYGGVNAMGAQSTATSSTRPAVFRPSWGLALTAWGPQAPILNARSQPNGCPIILRESG
jgi:hypothetical protein